MKKILIVDDNFNNLQVLANTLSHNGYDIEIAENGKEAIAVLMGEDFDLILLDIMMPVMNGFDACREIKLIESRKEIPIIFLTATTEESNVSKAFEVGGVDYITKPFNQNELLARVKTHIDLKESKDRLKNMNEILELQVAKRTEELRLATEELQVLDSAKTEFLDIISHEIRTPLNGIVGFIDLLADSVNDDAGRRFLNILERSTKRLENFSLKALEITQLKANKNGLLQIEQADVAKIITSSILKADADIKAKNIKVVSTINEYTSQFDKEQFAKCIKNILANAIKHAPEGGELQVKTSDTNDMVVITISDNGLGFPESILKAGIKPFISANHLNANPGLELYISKLIMQAHKGDIKIENDKGAKVVISLPKK